MLALRKISADSNGTTVAHYYWKEFNHAPEPAEAGEEQQAKIASGERIARYYTARPNGPQWRPEMPIAVAKVLGVDQFKPPSIDIIADLVEARRADNGEKWPSRKQRKISAYDLTFSPHKSWSLASAFAPTEAERQMIYYCETQANDRAMEYAAEILGWARKGRNGQDGAEKGEVGWITIRHKTARPTLHVEDGSGGSTHLVELAHAGDPQDHHHNLLFNLVVTRNGRIGSLDTKRLQERVHEIGAVYQAWLAEYGRRFGIEIGYDPRQEAAVITKVDPGAVDVFSKRHRQVERSAKTVAKRRGLDWDALDLDAKQRLLAESVLGTRMRKGATDEEGNREAWQAKANEIGWVHRSVVPDGLKPHPRTLTDDERYDLACKFASRHVAKEFRNAALLDLDTVRTYAARGLIGTGIRDTHEVDEVIHRMRERGITIAGRQAKLVFGLVGKRIRVTNTEQIRIEETVLRYAREAGQRRAGALSDHAIHTAIETSGLDFTRDPEHGAAQRAAIYALGQGADLAVLLGAAGAGKTTLLKPLVEAWHADGRNVIGIATAWRQAQALKDTGIAADPSRGAQGRPTTKQSIAEMRAAGTDGTYALTRFLRMVDRGEIAPDDKTVLVVDEISQIGPRQFLRLLELQKKSGLVIKGLGDREQVQAIAAGDTIALLLQVLPPEALPKIDTTVRQERARDRLIASMFRRTEAAEALALKCEDGTARLVGGDYDQVVQRIADFYLERRDARVAEGGGSVTVSALTNNDAMAIGQAIRARLKTRGEIAATEIRVEAIDQRGEAYDLVLAEGDQVRLFRQTRAQFNGHDWDVIGNNGDVLSVAAVRNNGLLLRTRDGRQGLVEWDSLKDEASGRIMLAIGYAMTVDSAQGITSDEHINALPRGTSGATAFKTYVAESRHRRRGYTLIAEAALREAVTAGRAFGDLTPVTEADLWGRAAKDMATKEYKPLAIDLIEQRRKRRERLVESWLRTNRRIETDRAAGVSPAAAFHQRWENEEIRQAGEPLVPEFNRVLDYGDGVFARMERSIDLFPARWAAKMQNIEDLKQEIAARDAAALRPATRLRPGS